MNPFILLLAFTLSYSLATPPNYASSKSSVTSYAVPTVTILKQINQLNGDGSYTFGYEASDGSFRVENMDTKGYLTGRYGYVDSYGKLQETEYVAGKMSGKSVGFQARGTSIPTIGVKSQPFPFIRTATKSVEQKALDYQYTSVDNDEDGFPDSAPVESNTGGDVRLVSPANSYKSATAIVRVADPNAAAHFDVRVLTPTKTTYETADDVRLVSPSKSSFGLTDTGVRVAEKNDRDTYGEIADIRESTPTRVSYEPVVVRVKNIEKATYDNSITSTKQNIQPINTNIKQLAGQVNIVRSPVAIYEKHVKSTGRLDKFLKFLKTNIKQVGNSYNTNESSSSVTLDQGQFQQDFQIQNAQPVQDDSISVDSIGFSSTV